jgi:hypothetical protein
MIQYETNNYSFGFLCLILTLIFIGSFFNTDLPEIVISYGRWGTLGVLILVILLFFITKKKR